jgi:toxin ParE1/3/4
MLVVSMVVYLLRLGCCLATTIQPDTPPTFKSSNTRFSHSSWSLAQADSYHRDLVATFEGLASGIKRGREVDVRPDYLKCPVGSHTIYFRDSGDQIEVIRVLHQRQDATLNL